MLKFFCIAAVTHAYLTPSPRRRSRAVVAATDSEQWDSFTTHHVGEWFGAKTVYDAAGKVVDEDSVAITCLRRDNDEVTHVLKGACGSSLRPDATDAPTRSSGGTSRQGRTRKARWAASPVARNGRPHRRRRRAPVCSGAVACPSRVALADGERCCTLTASFAPESDKTLALRRRVLSRERSDAFPTTTPPFTAAVEAHGWSEDGLTVDAPGGIAFRVAGSIEEGTNRQWCALRWNAFAADA